MSRSAQKVVDDFGRWAAKMRERMDAVTRQAQGLQKEALAKAREAQAVARRLESEMPPSAERTAFTAELAALELVLTKIGGVQDQPPKSLKDTG